jgi:hypothetical protein
MDVHQNGAAGAPGAPGQAVTLTNSGNATDTSNTTESTGGTGGSASGSGQTAGSGAQPVVTHTLPAPRLKPPRALLAVPAGKALTVPTAAPAEPLAPAATELRQARPRLSILPKPPLAAAAATRPRPITRTLQFGVSVAPAALGMAMPADMLAAPRLCLNLLNPAQRAQ